jgi:hypothetical protein
MEAVWREGTEGKELEGRSKREGVRRGGSEGKEFEGTSWRGAERKKREGIGVKETSFEGKFDGNSTE